MKNTRKIVTAILIFIIAFLLIPTITYGANELTSEYYTVSKTDKQISRVLPETPVDTFKQRFNVSKSDVKIYKSEKDKKEITTGNIATGMIIECEGSTDVYSISVIGDTNGDSKLTDIELNQAIKYVVGIEKDKITGILKKSLDINNDQKVDHIDVTLIIRYIVYGKLEIPETEKPKGLQLKVEGLEGENGYYIGEVTATPEKIAGDNAKIDKITYKINQGKEENLPTTGKILLTEEGEYVITVYAYSIAGEKVEGETKTVIIEKDIKRLETEEKVRETTIEIEAIAEAISGIDKYKYSIRKEGETENKAEQEGTASKIRFENLQDNTKYVITVEVISRAGNKKTVSKTVLTQKTIDNTGPTITINKGEVETNSIQVNITANDEGSGMPENPIYKYYIKEKGETEYKEVYSGAESSYTFTGLDQDTEYEIKVTTKDNDGNEGQETINVTTESLGGINNTGITYTGPEWNNGNASITLSTKTKFSLQYQKNNTNGEWVDIASEEDVEGLKHNDKVYARLWDGTNEISRLEIKIEDKTPPTIEFDSVTSTTSSINVKIVSNDEESGLASSPEYNYYIKKTNETEYRNVHTGIQNDYTFTGLTQNTEYNIKVTVKDIAENEGGKETKVSTKEMQGGEDSGITYTGPVWSNKQASITLSKSETADEELEIQWQKNGTTGNWTEGANVTGLKHGDKVYARLWDGINAGAILEILIEDIEVPTVVIKLLTITSSTIPITVSAVDTESGLASTNTYNYYIKKSSDANYESKFIGTLSDYTFTGLTQNTEYDIKVVVRDEAGNEGETAVKASTDKLGGETGGITASAPVWNNKQASITLSTNTGKNIQYQKNETSGIWSEGTTVIGLKHGDKVYARLWDGTNVGDTIEILVQDTIAPTVRVTKGTVTTKSIEVSVTSQDSESGIDISPEYIYFIKKKSETEYINKYTGPQNRYTFTELDNGTEYDIKVTVTDIAGNPGEATLSATTERIKPANGNITSNYTWSDSKAILSLSTQTEFAIEWQKNDNTGAWTEGTTVYDLNHNDVVWVRLSDGISGGVAKKIIIVDNMAPQQATITFNKTNAKNGTTIVANVTQLDNQSGISPSNSRWVYNTNSSNIGLDESAYTGGNFTDSIDTISFTPDRNNVYYVHILSVDNAGNKTETISESVTIREANLSDVNIGDYVQYTGNGWTSWRVLWIQDEAIIDFNGNTAYLANTHIVPSTSTETINYGTDSAVTARTNYANIVTNLRNKANLYMDPTYASSARSFGTPPANPTYDSVQIPYGGYSIRDAWPNNYNYDVGRAFNNHLIENCGFCWTPNRCKTTSDITSGNKYLEFGVFLWRSNTDSVTTANFFKVESSGTVTNYLEDNVNEAGFLPVILLKNTLKLIGGDGTQENPWRIGV